MDLIEGSKVKQWSGACSRHWCYPASIPLYSPLCPAVVAAEHILSPARGLYCGPQACPGLKPDELPVIITIPGNSPPPMRLASSLKAGTYSTALRRSSVTGQSSSCPQWSFTW